MPRIFISYRRDDSQETAGRLHDALSAHFGDDRVFMDVVGIELGDDFVEVIERNVGSCDILLAVIGKQWLTIADSAGRRRLDNPRDFVRLEIATAIKRKIRVIPLLARGASMPATGDLPRGLKRCPVGRHWSFGTIVGALTSRTSLRPSSVSQVRPPGPRPRVERNRRPLARPRP